MALNESEKPSRKSSMASKTSSVASEPATGETLVGTSVMRRQPASRAMASAASFTDWSSLVSTLTG